MTEQDKTPPVHHHKFFSVFFGIVLILIGLFSINARIFISDITLYFLGWILLIGGGAHCFTSFYTGTWSRFFVTMFTGIISFIIGGIIVVNPELGSQTLFMLISLVLIVDGLFKMADAIATHTIRWLWSLIGGILIFLLGLSMWIISPIGNIGLIGFLIGLTLVISGFITITNSYKQQPEYKLV